MRMLGIFLCVATFPPRLAGQVFGVIDRRPIRLESAFLADCAESTTGLQSESRHWRNRTGAAPRHAFIPLDNSSCRR